MECMHMMPFRRLAFSMLPAVMALWTTAGVAFADPVMVNMDDLPRRDLAARLTLVSEFDAPCRGSLQFGADGETIILGCNGYPPLGPDGRDPANPNFATEWVFQAASGARLSAHAFRTHDGVHLISVEYSRPEELMPLVASTGDGAWLAGTERTPPPTAMPRVFALYGSAAARLSLPEARSQIIAARRIGATRVAIVYEAWTDPAVGRRFPEPFVAIADTTTGVILSTAKLEMDGVGPWHVNGATIDHNSVGIFYRRFDAPPTQSDWYVGGRSGEVVRQHFAFDGSPISELHGFGFDAGHVLASGEGFLMLQTAPPRCGISIAALIVRDEVVQCYRRSRNSTNQTDHLRRQRPSEAEQYSYLPRILDGGRYVVIVGRPGVDEVARNPSASSTTHVFDADSGRYLGAIAGHAIAARDAPLLAINRNGRVSIWRLTQ